MPDNQIGAKIFAGQDNQDAQLSKLGRLNRTGGRQGDAIVDLATSQAKLVNAGLFRPPPTGQAVGKDVPVYGSAPKELPVPDVVAGIVVLAILMLEGTRLTINRLLRFRRRSNGDNR